MPTPYGPWTIKSTEQIYRDPFVELTLDQVIRPDGDDGQHVVVKIKPGVCVIAVDKERNVHLTKEFHYAVGRDSVEGVSGGVEPGEDADLTAKEHVILPLAEAARMVSNGEITHAPSCVAILMADSLVE